MLLLMVSFVQRAARRRGGGLAAALRHLGPLGLFLFAILDSSPLPTFGGPDILTAVLAATHRNPWYEYAAVATAGSVIGAYITFLLARRAGVAYLDSKFGEGKVAKLLKLFQRWGTGVLALSTAVPFPFPTSAFFAAAGASNYGARRFVTVVALCRGARYSLIAILADHYGRHFVRAVRHPDQYWGWLLLFALIIVGVIAAAILVDRRMEEMVHAGWS
jgi:membrane protein YqaA with SNARE-associated domain